jgi:hypothetical protein
MKKSSSCSTESGRWKFPGIMFDWYRTIYQGG